MQRHGFSIEIEGHGRIDITVEKQDAVSVHWIADYRSAEPLKEATFSTPLHATKKTISVLAELELFKGDLPWSKVMTKKGWAYAHLYRPPAILKKHIKCAVFLNNRFVQTFITPESTGKQMIESEVRHILEGM